MKNGQYISTKITINYSCKIYPIKSHILFTHAAKILHSHNWPDNVNRSEIAYIDESESLFYRPSVQRFCISRGTNTPFRHFAEWNHGCLGEVIFGEFIKTNMLMLTALMCFEDIKPFTTTRWNTFLKSVDIRKDLVENQANVAKAFLLDRGDTVQNEMTATKHKSFTSDSCPHAPVVKLLPVVDAVTSVVYQR